MSTFLPSPKNLDDIMKLDSLQDKEPEQIEALWMEVGPLAASPWPNNKCLHCPPKLSRADCVLTTLVAVPQRRHAEQGRIRHACRGVPGTAA